MPYQSHTELSPDAQFVLDYGTHDVAAVNDGTATAFAEGLSDVDERLLILDALYGIATDTSRIDAAINRGEEMKYGDGLIEVSSLDEFSRAGRRILAKAKNPAMTIRSDVWGDRVDNIEDAIPELLSSIGDFELAGPAEQFPKPSMPTGSSSLHLDNFILASKTGFKYAFSAAQLQSGRVLFVAGTAKNPKARDTSPKIDGVSHSYDEAQLRLEADSRVQELYASAQRGRPRGGSEFTTKDGVHIVSTVLNPGDVVIWPQGGPGSKFPSWHGFRKIGNEERSSVSYHYVRQSKSA